MRPLKWSECEALYNLMCEENFPSTPRSYKEAESFLKECLCFGEFSKQGQLRAALILGDITPECAFVDVVCATSWKGRWVTKSFLKWFYTLIFKELKLNYVWAVPYRESSLALASGMGFVPLTVSGNADVPTFVFTAGTANRKLFKF